MRFPKPGYLWYAASTFLSAFLLFSIQPVASKVILPYFGGSASVWAVSLIFFTGALFIGYAYVYVLTRLPVARQAAVHLFGIGIAAVAALALAALGYPGFDALVAGHAADESAARVLGALLVLVGAPFILLSTTAPLLQYWHGTGSGKEPYSLYAISNAGSLIALLSFPFLIEPYIPLSDERLWWLVLFCVYAVLAALLGAAHLKSGAAGTARAERGVSAWTKGDWVLYAALPALLLVSSTTILTQSLTSVPLLWIMPLALYLGTYIIAFSGRGRSMFWPLLVLVSAYFVWTYTPITALGVLEQTIAYTAFLFFGSLFCHATLYGMRPGTEHLPGFYLYVALGGVVGTAIGSFVAPFVFTGFFWEFPAAVALTAILSALALSPELFPRFMTDRGVFVSKLLLGVAIFSMLSFTMITSRGGDESVRSRNFYGPAEVIFREDATVLMHGTTMHGTQLKDAEWAHRPTTYYSVASGVGRSIAYTRDSLDGKPARVAVIGLGTGTLAAYCESGDTFVFYEIDSRIEDIAREHFTYLDYCKGSEVRIGDGRKLLEREQKGGDIGDYDLVVVDAFSDDSIPVHLVTKEAVETYFAHLRGDAGVVAIHTSNRYLELAPVILRIAREMNLNVMIAGDSGDAEQFAVSSQWVLLSRDERAFLTPAFDGVTWDMPEKLPPLWTDDYTSIYTVIRPFISW